MRINKKKIPNFLAGLVVLLCFLVAISNPGKPWITLVVGLGSLILGYIISPIEIGKE